eukprot:TRINITY_DN11043_c0_g1_i2.p1 TRINITY_DN11043_c0_g1~~TRINITY_DN11043_c0_g1_i2.p1  ORF type:complete len:831 (+),score=146.97 TRINITY_DN11043_c0_g1_i2:59-2551(+)
MRFKIDDLEVFFPFKFVYKEQLEYMTELKRTLDLRGHAILEMPTGTGKTVSLLSLILSYQAAQDKPAKFIYCTRTVVEMEKTLKELKFVIEARKKELPNSKPILALGLSARRNLCINAEVNISGEREKVDAECRKRTAEWVREKNKGINDGALCTFYEGFQDNLENLQIDQGVFTLEDLKDFGRKYNMCPYYLARRVIGDANVIVYNYTYLLDPDISSLVGKDLESESIVVFDEAHNIDDICIEVMSSKMNRVLLESASKNLDRLKVNIEDAKKADMSRLEDEYQRLVKGLSDAGKISRTDALDKSLPQELAKEAIPGNIRKAEHFLSFLKRFVIFVKNLIKIKDVRILTPTVFLNELNQSTHIDAKPLKFVEERLSILMNTLEIAETDEYIPIGIVAQFATDVATYQKGFTIIIEPYPDNSDVYDPLLQFHCLDSSFAMKPVFEKYRSVILTSGTMSPIEIYPRLLDFKPVTSKSIDIRLSRNSISPIVVVKGSDQTPLSSEFNERKDKAVIKNYGNLLIELCTIVPDGIICFFPSYRYMEDVVYQWNDMGILEKILEYKILYIESKDVDQTSISLMHFRKACDCGRGAVFLSIARGKVAEGIDFNEHYGRCVVMFGIPFQYTKSRTLGARLAYLKENYAIKESDFLIFDAMRSCAQCVGRVMRGKNDYGIMIFADKRYSKQNKRDKLPNWIKNYMEPNNMKLSVDLALTVARDFFRRMGQPFNLDPSTFHTEDQLKGKPVSTQSAMIEEGPNGVSNNLGPMSSQINSANKSTEMEVETISSKQDRHVLMQQHVQSLILLRLKDLTIMPISFTSIAFANAQSKYLKKCE